MKPCLLADGLQNQYEDLRQQALGSTTPGLGWALLVRQGMAAWMQALPALSPALTSTPPARSIINGPTCLESDLILALVALVLGTRLEVAHG